MSLDAVSQSIGQDESSICVPSPPLFKPPMVPIGPSYLRFEFFCQAVEASPLIYLSRRRFVTIWLQF